MATEVNAAKPSSKKIESLLLDILAPMRDDDDTLLHFEIDSQSIAKDVWANFVASLSATEARQWKDWRTIESTLSNVVQQNLTEQFKNGEQSTIATNTTSLALWLDRLIAVMRGIDQRTLKILALRIEGFDDRDISEQLETGLRCIKQITQEMQQAWDQQKLSAE